MPEKTKHTYIDIIDHGDTVLCDACGDDYTNRPECGGIQFQSKAYCPSCTQRAMPTIAKYNEQGFIRAVCPPDMRFAEWVQKVLRNGRPNQTRTTIVSYE